ncbi:hypothetical protein BaRGS_00015400 [Batillaria attramentaria]|uniref:Uncharacterized protein n=1 Tax=Batillaria attramentaria TaxID=370345 RepID=A0ABD0L1A1_9CAEN
MSRVKFLGGERDSDWVMQVVWKRCLYTTLTDVLCETPGRAKLHCCFAQRMACSRIGRVVPDSALRGQAGVAALSGGPFLAAILLVSHTMPCRLLPPVHFANIGAPPHTVYCTASLTA